MVTEKYFCYDPPGPCQPSYLKLLSTSNLGTRKFFSTLNQQYSNLALKNKWNNILNIDLDEKDWINIYKVDSGL